MIWHFPNSPKMRSLLITKIAHSERISGGCISLLVAARWWRDIWPIERVGDTLKTWKTWYVYKWKRIPRTLKGTLMNVHKHNKLCSVKNVAEYPFCKTWLHSVCIYVTPGGNIFTTWTWTIVSYISFGLQTLTLHVTKTAWSVGILKLQLT